MTIFPLDANIQKVDMLQIGTDTQKAIYSSTGSKLLDSLYHHHTVSATTALFGENTANELGLQHLEIPALGSTPAAHVRIPQSVDPGNVQTITARESAVSRVANIIKQDRNSIARG